MAAAYRTAVSVPLQRIDRSVHGTYRNTTRFICSNRYVSYARNVGQISLEVHLPVATRVHALGRFREKLHQRLRVPGLTRLPGHSLFTNSSRFELREYLTANPDGIATGRGVVRTSAASQSTNHTRTSYPIGRTGLANSKRTRASDQPEQHRLTVAGQRRCSIAAFPRSTRLAPGPLQQHARARPVDLNH